MIKIGYKISKTFYLRLCHYDITGGENTEQPMKELTEGRKFIQLIALHLEGSFWVIITFMVKIEVMYGSIIRL